jgi:hypothetical protein
VAIDAIPRTPPRSLALSFLTVNLLLLVGCSGPFFLSCSRRASLAGETEEEPPRLPSAIHTADPRASSQLVSGWHAIEQNAWRWTTRRFAVVLGAPRGAVRNGGILRVALTVPDVVISRLHSVSLSATIQEISLAAEMYGRPGDYVYEREVPAAAFGAGSVRVDFVLSKAIPPGDDPREFGLVVNQLSLESK